MLTTKDGKKISYTEAYRFANIIAPVSIHKRIMPDHVLDENIKTKTSECMNRLMAEAGEKPLIFS